MTNPRFSTFCFAFLLGLLLLGSKSTARHLDRREDDFGLHKRVDLNTLYNAVPGSNKVALGGAKHFKLDLTKSTTYTTAYFYGCTVVIAVDGGDVIIGHFAQEQAATGFNGQQSCVAMTDPRVVENNIINTLVGTGLFVDHTDETRVWIITSSGTQTVGYSMIREYFENSEVLQQNIIPFTYSATTAFIDFTNGPIGKAVVEVVPKSGESGATINVYIQSDTPSWSGIYDSNGNLVSTAK